MSTDEQLDDNRLSTADVADTDQRRDADRYPDEAQQTDAEPTRADTIQMRQSNGDDAPAELFGMDDIDRFRGEWRDLQARFVDDPRSAVQSADHLVAEVMQSLAATFAKHKDELDSQWQNSSEAETEDLRLMLRRYRTFFDQLLHA